MVAPIFRKRSMEPFVSSVASGSSIRKLLFSSLLSQILLGNYYHIYYYYCNSCSILPHTYISVSSSSSSSSFLSPTQVILMTYGKMKFRLYTLCYTGRTFFFKYCVQLIGSINKPWKIIRTTNLTFRWPCIVINSYNKTN